MTLRCDNNPKISCHNETVWFSPASNATMHYCFYSLTDAGSVRTNNEDSLAFDESHGVAILADGMGGYNAGEIASSMATEFIKTELIQWLSLDTQKSDLNRIERAIEMCADEANLSILSAAMANPHYAGMGTTLVVGVFQGSHLILGHIGDSRCYRLRNGHLVQMTRDHSMLQEQIDAGLITAEQATGAPGRNLLTRALGVEKTTRIEIHQHLAHSGDVYLMCSDGLSDMVKDDDIGTILRGHGDLQTIASELVASAIANGGRDNVSVLLARATTCTDNDFSDTAFLKDPLA